MVRRLSGDVGVLSITNTCGLVIKILNDEALEYQWQGESISVISTAAIEYRADVDGVLPDNEDKQQMLPGFYTMDSEWYFLCEFCRGVI